MSRLDGKIIVKSQLEVGSTFTMSLRTEKISGQENKNQNVRIQSMISLDYRFVFLTSTASAAPRLGTEQDKKESLKE